MRQISIRVKFIDGTERIVPIQGTIDYAGDEGARRATALHDGREVAVYNRLEWGYLWYEQTTIEAWQASQKAEG